jgi:transcriptional regulator with XRE-family HTH domain
MKYLAGNLRYFRSSFGLSQDQLAKALPLEYRAIVSYETGERIPPANILLCIAQFYGISLDFLALKDICTYPRNLKLLNLAKNLDNEAFSDSRSSIEGVIKTLLPKNKALEFNIKLDMLEIDFEPSFNGNLKNIRAFKKLTQSQLSETLGISKDLLAQYEKKTLPPMEKLINIADKLEVSLHALLTGERLYFDFADRLFGKTILSSDQILNLEDQKILVRLLEATINR